MRRTAIFLTLMLLFVWGVISFSSEAFGQSGRKVLMIPREGYSSDLDLMIKMEVGVMTILLKNAGFGVDIATTSGSSIVGPTQKIERISRLSEVNLDDYAGVIMACMAVGSLPGPPVPAEAVAIVKKALADGKPVAAQQGAIIILAEAGALKGKKYAFERDPLKPTQQSRTTDRRFVDAIYSGTGVVQDGKIITSGTCPSGEKTYGRQNGTVELTQKFIAAIGPPK